MIIINIWLYRRLKVLSPDIWHVFARTRMCVCVFSLIFYSLGNITKMFNKDVQRCCGWLKKTTLYFGRNLNTHVFAFTSGYDFGRQDATQKLKYVKINFVFHQSSSQLLLNSCVLSQGWVVLLIISRFLTSCMETCWLQASTINHSQEAKRHSRLLLHTSNNSPDDSGGWGSTDPHIGHTSARWPLRLTEQWRLQLSGLPWRDYEPGTRNLFEYTETLTCFINILVLK